MKCFAVCFNEACVNSGTCLQERGVVMQDTSKKTVKSKPRPKAARAAHRHLEFCCFCGEFIGEVSKFSWEHIVPLSRGGRNVHINKFPCHRDCNNERGNKYLSSWIAELQRAVASGKLTDSMHYKKKAQIENAMGWLEYIKENKELFKREEQYEYYLKMERFYEPQTA